MLEIKDIIDEKKIERILKKTKTTSENKILQILEKAKKKKGLTLEEIGCLVNVNDRKLLSEIFKIAGKIKQEIYGERLVFFAPLYISNFCVNDCEYCGFHQRNTAGRKKLTTKEIQEQVEILENMGHKRLLLEFGEDPIENPIDYIVNAIRTIYKTKIKNGSIRRVNVNIAATTVENYKKIKAAGIGTYQLFQETYHQETYKKLHRGPKASYKRQLFAHNRAFKAGIDDLGLGVLFGLYNWKFEVLALVSHAQYLNKKLGVGPHTFSVPRFQPAESVDFSSPYAVSEKELLKIIAILRVSVPYTGMIISTRERPETRTKSFKIGISQTSAASKTSPGGYGKEEVLGQFQVADHRDMSEIVVNALKENLLPSFCTACYRQKRTGKKFMKLAKTGEIHNFCRPNAILTFKEYLEDYAPKKITELGLRVMNRYLKEIKNKNIQQETESRVKRIENGERDIYF